MDLFEFQNDANPAHAPLAERLRPKTWEEFLGQERFASLQGPLLKTLKQTGHLPNLILWGPPGTGKTTFAHLLAKHTQMEVEEAHAVDTGAKRLREIGEGARQRRLMHQTRTLLFIDEIHRLNKAQQDVLLPYTERGDITLVGATTENPSYELNRALLSRCRVLVFERHAPHHLDTLVVRALQSQNESVENVLSAETRNRLVQLADGDARRLLNILEQIIELKRVGDSRFEWPLSVDGLQQVIDATPMYYDKQGDEHYDSISAFIKSIRGSDPHAGLYYLARMLEGGEDPVFIARRLVILASEDIGNADPRALQVAVAGLQAVELVGMPEAAINLAQIVTYLASAPKSNRSYLGLKKAQEAVRKTGMLPIPKALRSAQTQMAKELGYGRDYRYSHDSPKGYVSQNFLPEELRDEIFYEPADRGFEKTMREYMEWMKKT